MPLLGTIPKRSYGLVRNHQAVYPVTTMCRVLRVSPSGFYAWRKRGPSARAQRDAEVLTKLKGFHQQLR